MTDHHRRPRVEKIDAIARALGVSVDEARLAAGYAPAKPLAKPQTIPELVAALEQMGIEAPQLFGGYPQDPDGEGFKEIVERIWLDILMVVNRMNRGVGQPRVTTMRIDEAEIDNEGSTELRMRKG